MKVKRVNENAEHARQALKLMVTFVLLPVFAAIAFVSAYKALSVPRPPQQDEASIALTNRLHHAAMLNMHELQILRREARQAGYDTEEVDVRIWAAGAMHPSVLISIPPPSLDDKWSWVLSTDGGYAVAVASKTDAADRRTVGLYDLKSDEWLWTNKFIWPDTHEEPHVFNRALVLRYTKNNADFAMEVSPNGKIVSIDPLPKNTFQRSSPPSARPECPGQPVALKHNVFFVTDPNTWCLTGYAHCRLPGLYPVGKGDDNTRFSGNGRIKFLIDGNNGVVVVEDSLTQNVLQRFDNWCPQDLSFFEVTEATTTRDGSALTIFANQRLTSMRTTEALKKWSVTFDLFNDTVRQSVNANMGLSKPQSTYSPTIAFSRDDRWAFSVSQDYELRITTRVDPVREIVRVPLDKILGLTRPITHLIALEEGRYLAIRCHEDMWLLDISVIRNYASQLDRMSAADYALANPEEEKETEKESSMENDGFFEDWSMPVAPPIAPVALHAEQLYQHQAWFYAVLRFGTCMEYAAMDSRALRVNPLIFARAAFLSQQPKLGKTICRNALLSLAADRTGYNRMMRYHLQALYYGE